MLESDFVQQLVEALEGAGALCFKVHGHGMQKAGWPDLQVYSTRWTGHIEVKVNEDCSNIQKIVIGDLLVRGTPALVLRYVGGAVQAEDAHLKALGHVPAGQWSRTAVRPHAIVSLLEIATLQMRETGMLRPWVPTWQLDQHGRVVGQQAFERSDRAATGKHVAERAAGGGRTQTAVWKDGRSGNGKRAEE